MAKSRHPLLAVVTQPDRASGRGRKAGFSPVKQAALEMSLPVLQPERVNQDDGLACLAALGADMGVVVAFGQIFGHKLLDLWPRGMINLHFSLLPRHRGASPVQAALLAGDRITGVSVQQVARKLDSGLIYASRTLAIESEESAGALKNRLAPLGAALLVQTVDELAEHRAVGQTQDERQATTCRLIPKEAGRIAWDRPPEEFCRHVRAMNPWPGAFCEVEDAGGRTTRLVVYQARPHEPPADTNGDFPAPGVVLRAEGEDLILAVKGGAVRLMIVQRAGKNAMSAGAFLRGASIAPGARWR